MPSLVHAERPVESSAGWRLPPDAPGGSSPLGRHPPQALEPTSYAIAKLGYVVSVQEKLLNLFQSGYSRQALELLVSLELPLRLRGVEIKGLSLSKAVFEQADLSRANLIRATMIGTVLLDSVAFETDLSHSRFRGATLYNVNIYGGYLSFSSFYKAKIGRTVMDSCVMIRSRFERAIFIQSSLKLVHAEGSDFRNAVLNSVDLKGAYLMGADFQNSKIINSKLHNTDFRRAALSQVDLEGSRYSSKTKWPPGFVPASHSGFLFLKEGHRVS